MFERLGWIFMSLIILGAFLGLFGKGLLSRVVVQKEGFRMSYERFLHYGDPTTLVLEIDARDKESGTVPIALSNAYLFKFHLMQIVPTPEASADGDLTVFWFTTLTSDQPTTIQFRIEPESIGKIDGEIVINEKHYTFHQFIYP